GEGRQLVGVGVVAERTDALLVETNALQHPPKRAAREPEKQQIRADEQAEADMIEGQASPQIQYCDARKGECRLDVDVGAVRAAGKARVVKQRIEHLTESKRHHDEVEA